MRTSKKLGLAALVGGAATIAARRLRGPRASDKEFEIEYHVDADEIQARRTEHADLPVDVTADAAPLVSAERDALTVPGKEGETHRRRDQTAGAAAQEIAAAQVRERRSSEGEFADDEE